MSNGTHQTHVSPAPVTDSSTSEWVMGEGLLLLSPKCLGAGISLIILCYYSIFLRVALVCSLAVKQILLQALAAPDSLRLGNAGAAGLHQSRDRGTATPALCNPDSANSAFGARNCPLWHLWKLDICWSPSRVAAHKWVTVLSPAFLGTLAGDLI